MSNTMEQVLIGSILGDGSIGKYGNYCETHCIEQKDYLLWKKRIFDKLVFDKEFVKIRMRYYENKNSYQLYVPRHSIFQEYREISYPNGKKRITAKFIKRIGKLAICVWYFDDGNYCSRNNRITICSMSFSYEENQKLQRMLKNQFGLNFRIGCCRSRKTEYPYYICCGGKDVDKFLTFVKKNAPFIPKNMIHKLGKFDKRNRSWIERNMKDRKYGNKIYRQRNEEKIKKIHYKYYQENEEKMKKQMQDYYQKNKEKIKKRTNEYYQNNKEKMIKYRIKWKENNRKRIQESGREYYLNNKKRIKKAQHEYYLKINKGR